MVDVVSVTKLRKQNFGNLLEHTAVFLGHSALSSQFNNYFKCCLVSVELPRKVLVCSRKLPKMSMDFFGYKTLH